MTDVHWQLQDAKNRFSELVRRAQTDGAQFVTRHGADVVVVIDIGEYRRLHGHADDFKTYLVTGPSFEDLDLERAADVARPVDLTP